MTEPGYKKTYRYGPIINEISLRERWYEAPQVVLMYFIAGAGLWVGVIYFLLKMIQYPNDPTWWYAYWVDVALAVLVFHAVFESHWHWVGWRK
jgi:hypothetical protein